MPRIVRETVNILAIDKPAGLIVHSDGRTEEPSLAEWLIERYPAQAQVGEPWLSPQGEAVRVGGIVHRLDRTTSGILLAAKSPAMFDYLKGEFKARRVEKTYRAFVYGHPRENSGRIVAEIMRTKEAPRKWYARPCEESDPRAAISNWRVLRRFSDGAEPVAELELRPETGRTHQLRVHLASIGHSIVSDHLYDAEHPPLLGFTRPALHAAEIALVIEGKREVFTAPVPQDFE